MSTESKSLVQHIAEEARRNPEFARQLEADPRKAIEKMTGAQFPSDVEINVVRNTPSSLTIVLPPEPNPGGELSDGELARVAGGTTYCWDTHPVCWDTQDCIFFTL